MCTTSCAERHAECLVAAGKKAELPKCLKYLREEVAHDATYMVQGHHVDTTICPTKFCRVGKSSARCERASLMTMLYLSSHLRDRADGAC